jgi:hypothetical protein
VKPDKWYYYIHAGMSRTSTAPLFGKQWSGVVFAKLMITTLEEN